MIKKIRRTALRGLAAAAALAAVLSASSCGAGPAKNAKEYLSDSKFLLNTTCTVSLYDRQDSAVLAGAFQRIAHYDGLFSMTAAGSDVYKINHAGGKPVKVDPDTLAVIRESLGYSRDSGGLFDVTVGRLTSLWNIEGNNPKVPAPAAIRAAMATIRYQNIVLSGDTVMLRDKNAMIDLGGVAKGYIADKIKEYLVAKGVHSGIVNLGGNVVVIGAKNGAPWIVGVQQPFMDRDEDIGYLYVTDKSVVTSGIYERYFIQDGKLYAHILDPRTGYPVQNDLSSVTIISDESRQGDGLSATCFLLGVAKAEKLIESLKDTEGIFITKDGRVVTTPGIGKTVKFVSAQRTASGASGPASAALTSATTASGG